MSAVLEWVTSRSRSLAWFVTSLMGERAYDIYVAHLALEHPGQAPLGEREFWIQRYREQDANPGARCC